MISVKNISSKVIGVPQEGGLRATLLPDSTMEVSDEFKAQMEDYAYIGLVEITTTEKSASKDDSDDIDDVVEEKKHRGRRKVVEAVEE